MDIIIQARTTSTRLPQKVIYKLHDNNYMIELEIKRLKMCNKIDNIILATTINKTDDILIEIAKKLEIKYFRGDEDNVFERFYLAANKFNSNNIIRITGDCPFIDPNMIDNMIDIYQTKNYDFVSNTIKRTFPRGLDIEIFSFNYLNKIYHNGYDNIIKEHVTTDFYRNQEKYKIFQYINDKNLDNIRITVDTKEDYELIYKIYEKINKIDFTFKELLNVIEKNIYLLEINKNIEQKKI